MKKYLHILFIAIEAVLSNKFRSILTALGIIFGVAAVIAMMAIGSGAKQEIVQQMKMIGINNIIITPLILDDKKNKQSNEEEDNTQSQRFTPGLTLNDLNSITNILPTVKSISPQIIQESIATFNGRQMTTNLNGVSRQFFEIFNLKLEGGNLFSDNQIKKSKPVCIIGDGIKKKLFPYEDPIGKQIKCDDFWYVIIGVLRSKHFDTDAMSSLSINSYNESIYIPTQSLLIRVCDRSSTIKQLLQLHPSQMRYLENILPSNNNQLNKIIVQVDETENLAVTAEVLRRMLLRRHNNVKDFTIKVPELLLKQEQRTKEIFNIVLGAIASISLLVGGIGIMNIMLASILERIREIGVRLAIGARKKDIILQFLSESTLISLSGGIIGIILGILLSKLIMQITGILTIVSPISIIISFGVSASIGILFGFMPARKAAEQDPIESLRHD